MRRVCIPAVLSLLVIAGGAWDATADDDKGGVFDRQETVAAADGSLKVNAGAHLAEAPGRSQAGTELTAASTDKRAPDSVIGAAFCASADTSGGGNGVPVIEALCGFAPTGANAAVPGRGEVLAAFRELGLYRGAVGSDPWWGSMVNLETYFWCGDGGGTCAAVGEGERTVTLLGQAVRIRPRIVAYEWRFGDGDSVRVVGGRRVAHTYARAGMVAVSVTLTWTADYAVGGAGFRPVGGTTTTTSPVRLLPVREAEAVTG